MSEVLLAADYGYGVPWLIETLIIAIVVASGFFIYVAWSTKTEKENVKDIKYKLHKYHLEKYWSIFVAGILIWFWILGYPWMPPVAFEKALSNNNTVHLINVTAGQWFWLFKDEGIVVDDTFTTSPSSSEKSSNTNSKLQDNGNKTSTSSPSPSSQTTSSSITLKTGEIVKFVARSMDVNHGFGILQSSKSMDVPLMQMQVIPGFDNVFYFTFDKPGNYTVRCLEYCGWNHPFMVSEIRVVEGR